MAHDFGPRGIRVNAIAPGEIDTSILSPGTEKIVEEQIPMRRLGTPDDYAKLVHQIITNDMLNGEVIRLDGAIRLAPK